MFTDALKKELVFRKNDAEIASLQLQIAEAVADDKTFTYFERQRRLVEFLDILQAEVDAEIASLSKKPKLQLAA